MGMALQEEGRLLGDAHAARPLIPAATAELERLNGQRTCLRAEQAQLRIRSARLATADRQLAQIEAKLVRARRSAERSAITAAKEGEIAQAQAILQDGAARRNQLDQASRTQQATCDDARRAFAANLAQFDARAERLETERNEALREVARRLAELPPPFDAARVSAARQTLAEAETGLQRGDELLHGLLRQRAAAEEAQSAAARLHRRAGMLSARCAAVEAELADWVMFARCMGSDGLIALMIDDAGPELARLANDLLIACYGSRFTLSIRTQVDTAKGEAREGFEIMVLDGENGQAKPMSQMSGGERVWINDCLTRAIALYVSRSSERRYETLFTDESDGPLDAERKRMFMRMKREVLRLGGYEREYFISQTPEMAGAADVLIDLDAYKIS